MMHDLTPQELAQKLEALRDALVTLSCGLQEYQFELDRAGQDKAMKEVDSLLGRVRQPDVNR